MIEKILRLDNEIKKLNNQHTDDIKKNKKTMREAIDVYYISESIIYLFLNSTISSCFFIVNLHYFQFTNTAYLFLCLLLSAVIYPITLFLSRRSIDLNEEDKIYETEQKLLLTVHFIPIFSLIFFFRFAIDLMMDKNKNTCRIIKQKRKNDKTLSIQRILEDENIIKDHAILIDKLEHDQRELIEIIPRTSKEAQEMIYLSDCSEEQTNAFIALIERLKEDIKDEETKKKEHDLIIKNKLDSLFNENDTKKIKNTITV